MTHTHTYTQTDGHGDSMTDPAQRVESVKNLGTQVVQGGEANVLSNCVFESNGYAIRKKYMSIKVQDNANKAFPTGYFFLLKEQKV